ncbi:MAG: DNA polymerase, partial [Phaeodactylibacter sp.]|nr:DNA polymerase [Phaeodactylibacter sp.]
ALKKLLKKVEKILDGYRKKDGTKVEPRDYLEGLDGRRLKVRSKHSALNMLLQSAGAIIMKQALVILDKDLQELGLVPTVDYEFVANVHDEFQIETTEEHAETVGITAKRAIQKAGEELNFACPIDGEYDVGKTWADTH